MLIRYIQHILSLLYTKFLRLKRGVVIGKGCRVFFRSPLLNNSKGEIKIGNNTKIGCSRRGYHAGLPFYATILNDGENSSVIIGDNCRLNGVYIHAQSQIKIGNNCVMASGVNILDSNGHETKSLDRTKGRDIPKGIKIGNNVWIGLNATILKGVTIGDNVVVAAGCVVKEDVPSNMLVYSDNIKQVTIDIDGK